MYNTIKSGGKITPEKAFKSGNVRSSFDGQVSNSIAYMLVLEKALAFEGVTKIGYWKIHKIKYQVLPN